MDITKDIATKCVGACSRFWPAYYRISHIVTKTAITCEPRTSETITIVISW